MIYVLAECASTDIDRRLCALDAGVADEARDVELVGTAGLHRRALLEGEKIVSV